HLRIHGQIAKCMVDTGTVHCTLISNRFVEQYKLPVKRLVKPVNINLTIKGSRSGVNTSTTVQVEAGWDTFEHEFYIASLSQFHDIIGIDVLDRMEAMIDIRRRTVVLPGDIRLSTYESLLKEDQALSYASRVSDDQDSKHFFTSSDDDAGTIMSYDPPYVKEDCMAVWAILDRKSVV